MTVSTINGATTELRRLQESQNKSSALPYQPSGATLPEDVVNVPVPAAEGPNVAAATALSAQQNQAAAASTLTNDDIDFLESVRGNMAEQVQTQAKAALVAQTNKLPNNILALLAE